MKKLCVIIFLLLISGCTVKEKTKTIIENENNYVVSINYPITNIKKLDNKIVKYINKEYNDFKKNNSNYNLELSELNIDGSYDIVNNRYVKVYIEKYVYSNKIENFQNISFNFDIKKNEFVNDIGITEIKEKKCIKYTPSNKIINSNKKVIALTFDDGPSIYTESVLNVLNEYNARATFFVIGSKVKYYSNTLIDLLDSGNEIGNHTYNHKLLSKLKDDELLNQINKTQEIIKEYTGFTPTLFRPSYGSIKKSQREKIDLNIILWNVDTLDWKYKNSKVIANRALSKAKDGSIILMHDTHKRSVEALKIILNELKDEYEFVTISELLKIRMLRSINEE